MSRNLAYGIVPMACLAFVAIVIMTSVLCRTVATMRVACCPKHISKMINLGGVLYNAGSVEEAMRMRAQERSRIQTVAAIDNGFGVVIIEMLIIGIATWMLGNELVRFFPVGRSHLR
jgi:hypothetical protein